MSSQQILALVLFAVALCYAHEQKYCGRKLSRALAVLCYDPADDSPEKRSEGSMYNSVLAPYYKDQEPQYGWTWPLHKARAMSSSRGKRFVVNECCDKPCSINELMTYCD